jgi:hypothetical protein
VSDENSRLGTLRNGRIGSISAIAIFRPIILGAFQQHILSFHGQNVYRPTSVRLRASDGERCSTGRVGWANHGFGWSQSIFFLAHTDAIADAEDRRFIIAIESETDHLPIGVVRKLWAPDALKEKDVEIARIEELYRDDFFETCRRIARPQSVGG